MSSENYEKVREHVKKIFPSQKEQEILQIYGMSHAKEVLRAV
jgi:hypothetical protein